MALPRTTDAKLIWPRLLAGGFLLVTGVALALWIRGSTEPTYQGKTLDAWLTQLEGGTTDSAIQYVRLSYTSNQIQAIIAIRAIGTNAIPRILEDLHAEESPSVSFLKEISATIRLKLRKPIPEIQDSTTAQVTRWKAALALDALGPTAAPHVLHSIPMRLTTNTFPAEAKEKAFVLVGMGPKGLTLLTNLIGSRWWEGACISWAMAQHAEAATPDWTPFLINIAKNRAIGRNRYNSTAIWALGEIAQDPATTIPFLIECFTNGDTFASGVAATALGCFGPAASNAVPHLQQTLSDAKADKEVKRCASEALPKILGEQIEPESDQQH
jgi:hypothetical protein